MRHDADMNHARAIEKLASNGGGPSKDFGGDARSLRCSRKFEKGDEIVRKYAVVFVHGLAPFEVESYFRQLCEIWSGIPLDGSTCAGRLAKILERHVLRTERRWSVDARQLQRLQDNPGELERNFSGEKAFTVDDIRKNFKPQIAMAS